MRGKTIGDQELALLQYVAEQDGASVGEVAAGFGEERGLARSTVLTMMERLRGKAYLQRLYSCSQLRILRLQRVWASAFSARRLRVAHSLMTRSEPRKPRARKRRQSSAPFRQPDAH